MADQKVSDLPALNGADVDAADLLYIIDSSAGSAGSKKITVGQYQLAPVSAGTANGVVYLNASKVATAGSDLVFDGSRLGLGTTPSAWQADWNVYQASRDAAFGGVDGGSVYGFMSVNAYADGSASPSTATWRYQLTGSLASKYEQTSGEHRWFTAGTGTAGNAISFTQAMTLDASGNLSVGTTAGGTRLQVFTATDNVEYFRAGTSAESRGIRFSSFIVSGTNGVGHLIDAPGASGVNGTLAFATNSTERARITSGGDLLVGTGTTPSSSNAGFVVAKDADGTYLRNACAITTTRTHFEFVNGNGTVGTISTNASATAYNTSSDRRLKENIAPAADAGPVIDAIEIVQHDWKVGGHTRFGVIAQDLNAVAPEAVSAGDDGDEIEKTWGVDYSKLVPMLIKEIQSLRARVAALESA